MASPPEKKVTVGNISAFLIIGTAAFFDCAKIPLLFVDAIPFVGIAIGVIGSEGVDIAEILCVFTPLYFIGAYKGKNSLMQIVVTGGTVVADLTPIINDLPSTTVAVIFIIMRSRLNDQVEHLEHAAKYAAHAKHEKTHQVRLQRAKEAQQRANAARQQAMATSIAAANDNQRVSEAA